jgi:protein SCO1/2
LINQKNQSFSSSDISGSYYLIYFGFTKCPDICPATLIKLGRVLKLIRKMPEYHYMNLKCVFVSCDPDRDTPKRLKEYLKNFDDEIIGVTGISNEDPELKSCMRSFKIYANKIPLSNGEYSMDHTTITYLMDDENNYVDHLNPNLTEQEMAKAIVNRVLGHDYSKMKKRNQKPENRIC